MTKIAIILASMLGSYAFAGITTVNGNPEREATCLKYTQGAPEVQLSGWAAPVQMQQLQTQAQSEVPVIEMQPPQISAMTGQYVRQPESTPAAQPQREYFPGQGGNGYEAQPQPEPNPYTRNEY